MNIFNHSIFELNLEVCQIPFSQIINQQSYISALDQMVYKLYGLSEEEIKIVEGGEK